MVYLSTNFKFVLILPAPPPQKCIWKGVSSWEYLHRKPTHCHTHPVPLTFLPEIHNLTLFCGNLTR